MITPRACECGALPAINPSESIRGRRVFVAKCLNPKCRVRPAEGTSREWAVMNWNSERRAKTTAIMSPEDLFRGSAIGD